MCKLLITLVSTGIYLAPVRDCTGIYWHLFGPFKSMAQLILTFYVVQLQVAVYTTSGPTRSL